MDKSIRIALLLTANDRASAIIGRAFAMSEKRLNSFQRIGRSMSDFSNRGIVAGAALAAPFAASIKAASDFEKLGMSLNVLTGSAEKGAALFAQLKRFAFDTPFEVNEVIQAQKTMMGFGLSTGEAYKNLRILGDVAAVTGGSLGGVTLAFSQASAKGKLMAQDINQLVDNGVPIIDMLAKSMGIATNQVKIFAEKGLITYPVMIRAFEKATASGGKFHNGMELLSNTTAGRFAKMSDNVMFLSVRVGEVLLPSVNKLLDRVIPLLDRFSEWSAAHPGLVSGTAKFAAGLIAFSAAVKIVGFAFSGIGTMFSIFKGGFLLTKGLFGFGQAALKAGSNLNDMQVVGLKVGGFLKNIGPMFKTAGLAVIKFGATLLASPITWYVAAAVALGAAVYFIIRNWGGISNFFSGLWQKVKSAFTTFWNWTKNFFFNYTPHGILIKHWDKIPEMFSVIWDRVKGVFTGAWDWLAGLGGRFFEAGKNIVKSIARGIIQVAMLPVQAMMGIVQKIRNYLPFSPAKEGPLRDIHRIRLVETVAQGITAKPLIRAWSGAMGQLHNQMARPLPVRGGSSPTFSLTVNLSGGATQQDASRVFDTFKAEADRWWAQKQHNMSRVGFQS